MSSHITPRLLFFFFFFFNDTATTEIYTLSLHDALPISDRLSKREDFPRPRINVSRKLRKWSEVEVLAWAAGGQSKRRAISAAVSRSEEHTSELQSLAYLVCRHLLEKKNA